MKKGFKIFVIIIFLILIIILFAYKFKGSSIKEKEISEKAVACTLEAKMCPDGTYVGRVAPSCEFEQCKIADNTTPIANSRDDVKIKKMSTSQGQYNTFESNGASIVVTEILEDSRCPVNVQCVWEGTIIVRADVNVKNINKELILELNKPVSSDGKTITLIEAGPKNNYNFKFNVK